MLHWNQPSLAREQLVLIPRTLDDVISPTHPVRFVEEFLGTLDWSAWEGRYCLLEGRPPIHPRVLASAIIYGLWRGIRSSRALEEVCRHRIDFMWLMEGRTPDHSTFADFRTRFSGELKDLMGQLLRAAQEMKLIKLTEVGFDGTHAQANNSRANCHGERYVRQQIDALDQRIEQMFAQVDVREGLWDSDGELTQVEQLLVQMHDWRQTLQQTLERLEEENRKRGKRKDVKGRAKAPLSDTDARLLPNKEGGYDANYTPTAMVDGVGGLIVTSEVTVGNGEAQALVPAVKEVQRTLGQRPEAVSADSGFHNGPDLRELETLGVQTLIPPRQEFADNPAQRPDPTQPVPAELHGRLPINPQSKTLDHAAFIYEPAGDRYHCPQGRTLEFVELKKYQHKGRSGVYRVYQGQGCEGCPLKSKCVPKDGPAKRLHRDEYEDCRQRVAQRMATEAGREARRRRGPTCETVFAVIKGVMGLRQFLLRGLEKVQTEWNWAVLSYNVMKLKGMLCPQMA